MMKKISNIDIINKNGQVIVNNMSPEKQLKFNAKIRNIYNELKTKVTDKCLLDKDEMPLKMN